MADITKYNVDHYNMASDTVLLY